MSRHLLRVWLPDRPGSLGELAGSIGDAGGNVEGVEILESGAGRAIDELLVSTEDIGPVVAALARVDGVDVEWVKPAEVGDGGPDLEALEAGARLLAATDVSELAAQLAAVAARLTQASWAVVARLDPAALVVQVGEDVPTAAWLAAFVAGSRYVDENGAGIDDMCWAELGPDDVLALGRQGHQFRTRELRRVHALAAMASFRLAQLRAHA